MWSAWPFKWPERMGRPHCLSHCVLVTGKLIPASDTESTEGSSTSLGLTLLRGLARAGDQSLLVWCRSGFPDLLKTLRPLAEKHWMLINIIWCWASSFLHSHLEAGFRKVRLFDPHSSHLTVWFCKKRFQVLANASGWRFPAERGHFSGHPWKNLWDFSQVPLVQGSQSIVDSPKEGLVFWGIPSWEVVTLQWEVPMHRNQSGERRCRRAGNGNWLLQRAPCFRPSSVVFLLGPVSRNHRWMQRMDEDWANICLGQDPERYD